MNMLKRKAAAAAVAAAFVPVFFSGCSSSIAASEPAVVQTAPTPVQTGAPARALPDFSTLVAQVGPAVVNISTTTTPAADKNQLPFDQNDPMYQFFRQFQIPMPQQGPTRGIGSGFIITPDGYILTNAHVVNGANEVDVKLTDRREFTAKVVGQDPRSDIALLKIDASGLPTVKIGDPKNVKVGEWVLAMGSPFGFENSATAGIVSAKSRSLPGDTYAPFIQTDVAVNPGNSGGPLFDLNGNVVGINSQIYTRSGGYMGVSFAIPIDVAMNVENQLQHTGKVEHGRIGVAIQEVNQSLAQSFGLKSPTGALVSSVSPDSPAAQAGIKSGDVILAFNGKPVEDSSDLPRMVGDMKPGQKADVRVWRNGSKHDLNVTVGAMPNEKIASNESGATNSGKLGLAVRPLTPDEKKEIQAKAGLVVEQSSGAAAKAGIQPGDVILAFDNEPVASAEQLRHLLDHSGKHVALLVQRQDSKIYVPVDLG